MGEDAAPPPRWTRRLGLAVLGGLHLSLAGYVGWVVWLLTDWSADDLRAAGAGPGGTLWLEQAGWSLAAALAVGLLLYLLNRLLLTRWLGRDGRRWSAWLAAGAGALVLATGLLAGRIAAL